MRIATIGTGNIVEKIIFNMQKTRGLSCHAVYSRTLEKGQALAAQFHVPKVYTSLDELWEDTMVEAVYIASPNSLHYAQAKAALLHGKHVICEKPMAPYYAQAKELFELAAKKNLMLFEAVTIAHAPNFALVKAHLKDVGRPRLVLCSYSQYSSRYDQLLKDEVTNVFNPDFCGGALMDINYYNVYEVAALFGRPKTVAYYPNAYKNGIDTSGILVMQYEDFVCQCTGAKDTAGVNGVQIQGEKGYIYVEGSTNASGPVRVVTSEGEIYVDDQQEDNQWYYEMESLGRLMPGGDFETCRPYMEASLDTAWILETARRSAGMPF